MIQSILNKLYRHPKANLKRIAQFGGYVTYRRMLRNRKLMEKASLYLHAVSSYADGLPLYFLTGKNYLYQTLFCIQSLNKNSTEKFKFILVDDGSFDQTLTEQINRQLPGAEIITKEIVEQNLDKYIPAGKYPTIRHKRIVYPHLKKLTDIHTLPGSDWKLVLDSDMLFWDEPKDMINWLKDPKMPVHLVDCAESYGYSKTLMGKLSGTDIPPLLNVGIIGLSSSNISWRKLNTWINALEAEEGATYYLEQALSAMLVAGHKCKILDAGDYVVNPSDNTILNSKGSLHHYVDISKKGYYNYAWQKIIDG